MESLGGDQMWWDRFLAQHSAIFYFWVLILFYTFAPRMAYVFSELVEVSLVAAGQVIEQYNNTPSTNNNNNSNHRNNKS